jgi:hypothetical protein
MKPLIQIDDEVREMTEQEYELWLATVSEPNPPPST